MRIKISKNILNKLKDFNIIAYQFSFNDDYDVMIKSTEVNELLTSEFERLKSTYIYEDIPQIKKLKETRLGYRDLGKDPSHTRPACEALLRRVVKGQELYRLGDVIDLGNILSMRTLRSVCVVDFKKIVGDVLIDVSSDAISYEGIGRGAINATNLITYHDDMGIFGSPTSDTYRTAVTNNTKTCLIMIICFSENDISNDQNELLDLYQKYTKVKNIEKIEVIKESN